MLALVLGATVAITRLSRAPTPAATSTPRGTVEAIVEHQARAYLALESRESEMDRTTGAAALLAFQHEDVLLQHWREFNQSSDPWTLLASIIPDELRVGTPQAAEALAPGTLRQRFTSPSRGWTRQAWAKQFSEWKANGWIPNGLSLRQIAFKVADSKTDALSTIALQLNLTNASKAQAGVLRGDVQVAWNLDPAGATPTPKSLDLTALEWMLHTAPPWFQPWFEQTISSSPTLTLDPVLCGDLDGDGTSEVVLVGAHQLLSLRGGQFESKPLATIPPSLTHAAVLADLNHDHRLDLLVATDTGLYQLNGQSGADPFGPAIGVWRPEVFPASADIKRPIKHAQVLTVADMDGDGDLDVFLGQYKVPYQKGQFPTPYFDANDGFASYILRNRGDGSFEDVTATIGLGARRNRRIYSASWIDLDGDRDADLVVVGDFAGVDLFLNDGRGQLVDVTQQLGDARYAFGMAHGFGDWNGDGHVDLLAVGMDSPTAAVLDSIQAARGPNDPAARYRRLMTYGNRWFRSDGTGRLIPDPHAAELAKAGWAWGVSVFDADNDADLDVYLANGHETMANPTDYERQFWLHDVYVGTSSNDPVAELYFRSALGRRRAGGQSYGGWQRNRWFVNQGTTTGRFDELAGLHGIDHPEDCRNVLSEDFDGDGRLDLVVTSYEQWPQARQRVWIHKNQIPNAGHWVGFRFPTKALNARVRVQTSSGLQTRWLVTGDSYRSQHSLSAHFGLGSADAIQWVDVLWPDGKTTDLGKPTVDRWHRIE